MPKSKSKMNEKNVALVFGTLFAIFSIIWVVMVAVGGSLIDWILKLHFVQITILPFDAALAVGCIVMHFIGGCIVGWLLAIIWNWAMKRK